MQQLASDLNNTEFVGAIPNPDALLHIEFFMHKPMDKWSTEEASHKAGRLVRVYGEEQPFVRIMRPGDQHSIIETPAREEHKMRWPEHWMRFQMNEGLVDIQEIPGWQLEEWPYLLDKPDMLREFKYVRFSTVEQIAGASDAQVQRMGLGGVGIREQARADLRKKLSTEMYEAVKEKDEELQKLKESDAQKNVRLEELERQLHLLMNQAPAEPPPPQPDAPRRGRPPKEHG